MHNCVNSRSLGKCCSLGCCTSVLSDANMLYGTCSSSAQWKYLSPSQENVIICNAHARVKLSVFGLSSKVALEGQM